MSGRRIQASATRVVRAVVAGAFCLSLIAAGVAGAALAGAPSARAIVEKVNHATDAQLVFDQRLANGHGAVDVTLQNRTSYAYEVLLNGRLWTEYLQVRSKAVRYELSKSCFTVTRGLKIMPISLKTNDPAPFAGWQPGGRYTLSPDGFRWSSYTTDGRLTSSVYVRYNSRFEVVSGTVFEPLGGRYPYQLTQSYPSTIPESEFAAPTDICPAKT